MNGGDSWVTQFLITALHFLPYKLHIIRTGKCALDTVFGSYNPSNSTRNKNYWYLEFLSIMTSLYGTYPFPTSFQLHVRFNEVLPTQPHQFNTQHQPHQVSPSVKKSTPPPTAHPCHFMYSLNRLYPHLICICQIRSSQFIDFNELLKRKWHSTFLLVFIQKYIQK